MESPGSHAGDGEPVNRCDRYDLPITDQAPVIIGGLGGSGTRLVTRVLEHEGVNFAGAVNDSLDNLWFTLLFVRRSILLKPIDQVRQLAWLFNNAMRQAEPIPPELTSLLHNSVRYDRGPALRRGVLAASLESLLSSDGPARGAARWGWKQPNSHVMISLLRESFPALKYIYVVRNGLDMALSYNQNQLMYFWGDIMLDGDVSPEPRNALRYWVASYRRLQADAARFSDQVYILDYDRLCAEPRSELQALNTFLELDVSRTLGLEAEAMVTVPDTTGRHRAADLAQFVPDDLNFLKELGYALDV